MQEEEKVSDIWKRIKKQCEVSDVLVLNRNGEINCYYVDENYPQYLAGFIRINTSGTLITMDTENYLIDGKNGNWMATDTIVIDGEQFYLMEHQKYGNHFPVSIQNNSLCLITMDTENYQIDGKNGNRMATDTIVIDGEQFYLMEHQKYGNQAQGVILDAYGKMIKEECERGFDEATKQKIHEYIQQHIPQNPVYQIRRQNHQRLEHYQKYYLNGTYERSRESGTEANYDMVDGMVNNQKNPAKVSNPQMNKKRSQNQRDHVPKKRRSVIKRLREKQIAIAVKSGKPIPKNLDQEMERHK